MVRTLSPAAHLSTPMPLPLVALPLRFPVSTWGLCSGFSVALPLQASLLPSDPPIPVARAPEGEDFGRAGRGQKARTGTEAEALPVGHPGRLPEGGARRSSPLSTWPLLVYRSEAKSWASESDCLDLYLGPAT